MKLFEHEEMVKALIEEDINNPEVFEALRTMIYYWLLRTKKIRKKRNAYEIATEMAGDLYMKILSGEHIEKWLAYIKSICYSYIKDYKEFNFKQYFNLTGDPDAVISMAELFGGSFSLCNIDTVSFNEMSDLDFINDLPRFIIELVDSQGRYKKDSVENLNLRVSLLLSLIRADTDIFRISENDLNYVKLLKNSFKVNLIESLKRNQTSTYLFDVKTVGSLFETRESVDNYE